MSFSGGAQMVENDAWLDAGDALLGVNLQNLRHVLGEVEHDGDIAALARERGASAAAKHRGAVLAAGGDGSNDVVVVSRNYDANWDLAIIRAVGGVECAAAVIKPDFTADVSTQCGFECRACGHGLKDSIHHRFRGIGGSPVLSGRSPGRHCSLRSQKTGEPPIPRKRWRTMPGKCCFLTAKVQAYRCNAKSSRSG